MHHLATVCIVMTVYNREQFLSAAIESVLNQTHRDFELLIWDDGSTDRSLDIALSYAQKDDRIRVIEGSHLGSTGALKAATAQTNSTYLGWVDSDDVLAPTAIEKTLAALETNLEAGYVYTDYLDIDERDHVLSYGYRCLVPYSREGLLTQFMTFHFRLIRRSVFEQVGGIDETAQYVEDYDICLRLSEIAPVIHIPEPLYYYRTHAESVSHQKLEQQKRNSNTSAVKAFYRRQILDRIRAKQSILKLALQSTLTSVLALSPIAMQSPSQANPIAAPDGTNTIVTPNGNQFDITGGQISGDGSNQFHSFLQFNLNQDQTANFIPNSIEIRNILGRVVGGDPSVINGTIRVSGGVNFFLMNPAGIIFGANSSINTFGAFTATTANGIGFESDWFNALGNNDYVKLNSSPNAFAFSMEQPGAIINAGNLSLTNTGYDLALIGGSIVSSGQLSAATDGIAGGRLIVVAVPGRNLVQLRQPGQILSFEIQPLASNSSRPFDWTLPIQALPRLLTNNIRDTTVLTSSDQASVDITNPGDVVVSSVSPKTSTNIYAANNVSLGNYSGGSLKVEAVGKITGGNITINSDTSYGISSFESSLFSSGAGAGLVLRAGLLSRQRSNLSEVGTIRINNVRLIGGLYGDPVALILESPGNISTGIINTSSSFDGSFTELPRLNQGGFVNVRAGGSITAGEVTSSASGTFFSGTGGSISLVAGDSIETLKIDSSAATSNSATGGDVFLRAGTSIATGTIDAYATILDTPSGSIVKGGSVEIIANNRISAIDIDVSADNSRANNNVSSSLSSFSSGSVRLQARNDIEVRNIVAGVTGNTDELVNSDRISNSVNLSTATFIRLNSISTTGGRDGSIFLQHGGNGIIPFQVGKASVNGSLGSIVSEETTLAPRDYYSPFFAPPNIRINTGSSSADITDQIRRRPIPTPPNLLSATTACANASVAQLEDKFVQQYEKRLGAGLSGKTVLDSCETLRSINAKSGVKPAIVYVTLTKNHLELFLVTAKGIKPVILRDVKPQEVLDTAIEFQKQVSSKEFSGLNTYQTSGQKLHDWMIKPIESELKAQGINNLSFVMDEGLRMIPLAALYDKDNQNCTEVDRKAGIRTCPFLIERYSVGLMPSLSLTDTRYVPVKSAKVLATGRSNFRDVNLDSLPGVPIELALIDRIWEGTTLIPESKFNFSTLKSARQQEYGIVHLATHASFAQSIENTFIQLGGSSQPSLENTRLRLKQLRELGFDFPPKELLVLSACETALGSTLDTELGFAGLATQAGVKSALGSLWTVEDGGTVGLMAEFYQQLKAAPIKAEALRQAQLAMLRQKVALQPKQAGGVELKWTGGVEPFPNLPEFSSRTFEQPYYWAAFTLVGSPW